MTEKRVLCEICRGNGNMEIFRGRPGLYAHIRKHGLKKQQYDEMYGVPKRLDEYDPPLDLDSGIDKKEMDEKVSVKEPILHQQDIERQTDEMSLDQLQKEKDNLDKIMEEQQKLEDQRVIERQRMQHRIEQQQVQQRDIGQIPEEEYTEGEENFDSVLISDYKILPNDRQISAMFIDETETIVGFKEVIAVGTVDYEGSSVISAMVIGNEGILTPVFMMPGFKRIIEGVIPKQRPPKKQGLGDLLKSRLKKEPPKKLDKDQSSAMSKELMTEFSKYLQQQNKEEKSKFER